MTLERDGQMHWVFWGHEIPAMTVPIQWQRRARGRYVAQVELAHRNVRLVVDPPDVVHLIDGRDISLVSVVATTPREVARAWAVGVPAMLDTSSVWTGRIEALMDLVARCLPVLRPMPTPLLSEGLGFRTYCCRPSGRRLAWWQWKGTESPRCDFLRDHAEVPARFCSCGFHIAPTPWVVPPFATHSRHRVLVVAPWGRTVFHRDGSGTGGARTTHYDVLAAVAPLDARATPQEVADPRFTRARNCTLRAWEIAQEILAARTIGG